MKSKNFQETTMILSPDPDKPTTGGGNSGGDDDPKD